MRLGIDQRQNAARAGQARSNLRISKRRTERGKAEEQNQAVIGHHLTHIDESLIVEQQRMRQRHRRGNALPEQGHEARFDVALLHKGVAIRPRVALKLLDRLIFLRGPFHRFDAFDVFGQRGVHVAELPPHGFGGGSQVVEIALQREKVRRQKDQRGDDQRRVDARRDEDGHHQKHERSDDQIDARIEHEIDFAHVVGGARHHLAHRLLIVERHALADQAGVQFVACVAFQPLPDDLAAEIAAQLQHGAHHLRHDNADGGRSRADRN